MLEDYKTNSNYMKQGTRYHNVMELVPGKVEFDSGIYVGTLLFWM